jgi:hypothetical protein
MSYLGEGGAKISILLTIEKLFCLYISFINRKSGGEKAFR